MFKLSGRISEKDADLLKVETMFIDRRSQSKCLKLLRGSKSEMSSFNT